MTFFQLYFLLIDEVKKKKKTQVVKSIIIYSLVPHYIFCSSTAAAVLVALLARDKLKKSFHAKVKVFVSGENRDRAAPTVIRARTTMDRLASSTSLQLLCTLLLSIDFFVGTPRKCHNIIIIVFGTCCAKIVGNMRYSQSIML